MIKYIIVIVYIGVVTAATICHPSFLAKNEFLKAFISHELLGLLAVVMTITFASVANIHLTISRLVAQAPAEKREAARETIAETRSELNSSAWLLFWAFIAAAIILLVKGTVTENVWVESAANGLALGTLLVNALVFYDIYQTSFVLASSDIAGRIVADES